MADVKVTITAQDDASRIFSAVEKNSKSAFDSLKKNWLAVTAAVAGAMIVLNKAWNLAEMAAQFEEQKTALNALASQYNTTASQIIDSVQKASKGLISMTDAVSVSAKALMMGLNPTQLTEFMRVVEATTNVTGAKVADAFEQITQAAATGRERTLKQMGIMVDLNGAYKDYAQKIGKTVDELSELEKQQAGVNAILAQGESIVKKLGDSADSTADKMERLSVTVQDLQLKMGTILIRVALGAVGAFQWLSASLLTVSAGFWKLVEGLTWVTDKLGITKGALHGVAAEAASTAWNLAQEQTLKATESFKAMVADSEKLTKAMAPPKITTDTKDTEKAITKLNEEYKKWKKSIDDLNPALNKNMKELNKLQEEAKGFIKAGKDAIEVNKELARATSYLDAGEKAEAYREAVKSQIDAIKENIDYLKEWRSYLVNSYNEAINKAKEYYNTVNRLDEALSKSKAFLEDVKGAKPKIFGFEEEQRTLQSSIQRAVNTKDVNEVLTVMNKIEEFINKYKGKKDFIGFDFNLSGVIKSYESLITRVENFRDINQQAGDAWISKANEITSAIQQIDNYVTSLDTKLKSLQAILDVAQAVQAAQYLRGEIDFYLPDIMTKTIVVKTIYSDEEEPAFKSSFQSGTPYVPQTGLYKLHQGEAVVPASKNKAGTGGDFNFSGDIIIQGANKDGRQLAKEIDEELADMIKYNRSQIPGVLKG